ncbi:cystathionine beta-lyase [Roseiarcus fermentans]|uniref:Cystathionine beta-lyase n=1 Tax=Roseiarcus fermentans TaxID=1473586 RepID=A0A366EKQ7_9HYPH|nr:cystathionine beta-lyase [Roseiarcus fermentans]RBP02025.1 cystathionine beta-lyase [Roseiarcus fermentans]
MTKLDDETRASLKTRSRLVHLGRDREQSQGFVNIPPFRGSTVLYPDAATLKSREQRYTYGTHGTPSTDALTAAWSDISGAAGTELVPSGLAAIVVALMTAVSAGDHLLITDSAYGPARAFANGVLKRMGVETTFYDPCIGAGIEALFRENTRAVLTESPGSQSFEVQDIPAIAEAAHARGAAVLMDNTWATPLLFAPHAHGVDMAIEAGTKYLSGHSDLLLGLVSANEAWFPRLRHTAGQMAIPAGPEDVFLALRGLRTMDLRLREAERQGLAMARWLSERPEVLRVLHPALPDDPGHALWKRDFSGSSGLFSVILKPASEAAVAAFLDGLQLFGLGYSWGGYESLVIPFDCSSYRTATRWAPGGPALRFSIGLEDSEDLKADLDRGFARLRATT